MSDINQLESARLHGIIYGSTIESSSQLILDVRDIDKQTISYVGFDLHSLKVDKIATSLDWWTKLISSDQDWIYLLKYKDRNNPNSQVNIKIPRRTKNTVKPEEVEVVPSLSSQVIYPSLYENGTEYHKMVSDFLGLALPLSTEYLEWNDKIIISYYLRSGNEFDRYLLLLDNGKKEWKLHQDHKMKGFSPESFFIHNEQLIFFKELNEVCIYTL